MERLSDPTFLESLREEARRSGVRRPNLLGKFWNDIQSWAFFGFLMVFLTTFMAFLTRDAPWWPECVVATALLALAARAPWLHAARGHYSVEYARFLANHPAGSELVATVVQRACRSTLVQAGVGLGAFTVILLTFHAGTDVLAWLRGLTAALAAALLTLTLSFFCDRERCDDGSGWAILLRGVGLLTVAAGAGVMLLQVFGRKNLDSGLDAEAQFINAINPLAWPFRIARGDAVPAVFTVLAAVMAVAAIPLWRRIVPGLIARENPWVTEPTDETDLLLEEDDAVPAAGGETMPAPETGAPVQPAIMRAEDMADLFAKSPPEVQGFWERLIVRWYTPRQVLICEWARTPVEASHHTLGRSWLLNVMWLLLAGLVAKAAQFGPDPLTPWHLVNFVLNYGLYFYAGIRAWNAFSQPGGDGYPFALLDYPAGAHPPHIVVLAMVPVSWRDVAALRMKSLVFRFLLLAGWAALAAPLLWWALRPPEDIALPMTVITLAILIPAFQWQNTLPREPFKAAQRNFWSSRAQPGAAILHFCSGLLFYGCLIAAYWLLSSRDLLRYFGIPGLWLFLGAVFLLFSLVITALRLRFLRRGLVDLCFPRP